LKILLHPIVTLSKDLRDHLGDEIKLKFKMGSE